MVLTCDVSLQLGRPLPLIKNNLEFSATLRAARKIRSFIRWPRAEKAWFFLAWLVLGMSRLMIVAVAFRHLAPWLGTQSAVRPWIPLLGVRSETRAASIGRAVRRAARFTPWESNCLPQAITARILLGLCGIPYSLFFGVRAIAGTGSSPLKVSAHAWVASGRVAVTGGASFDQFTVIGCFVPSKPTETTLRSR